MEKNLLIHTTLDNKKEIINIIQAITTKYVDTIFDNTVYRYRHVWGVIKTVTVISNFLTIILSPSK